MRRDANAITAEDGEGTTHIPSATIGVLSLGSCAPTGAAEGACAAAHPHVRGALPRPAQRRRGAPMVHPHVRGALVWMELVRRGHHRSIPTCVGLSGLTPW